MKVTICGAAGRVGQPLSLMLKQSNLIDELSVYDIEDTCAFGTELGHVDTKCKVFSYTGKQHLQEALEGSKIVVIVSALRKSAFLPYNTMLKSNGNIIRYIVEQYSQCCPKAMLAIATNPINSLIPLASQVLINNGVYNPQTIFGVTTLDVVRANTFAAEVQGLEPECVFVPVIGGNVEKTIIPLFSRAKPCSDFSPHELDNLTKSVQNAHYDIIKAKHKQSATLSCAFAISRFVISLVKALRNYDNIVECAFVKSDSQRGSKYLSTPVLLGPRGIHKNFGIPELSEFEICQLETALPILNDDIKKGEEFLKRTLPDP